MNPTVNDILNAIENNDIARLQNIFYELTNGNTPTYYNPEDEHEWDRNVEFEIISRER